MLRKQTRKQYLAGTLLLLLFLVALVAGFNWAQANLDPASPWTKPTLNQPTLTPTPAPAWWNDVPTPIVVP